VANPGKVVARTLPAARLVHQSVVLPAIVTCVGLAEMETLCLQLGGMAWEQFTVRCGVERGVSDLSVVGRSRGGGR
jgi:hypothetical protein